MEHICSQQAFSLRGRDSHGAPKLCGFGLELFFSNYRGKVALRVTPVGGIRPALLETTLKAPRQWPYAFCYQNSFIVNFSDELGDEVSLVGEVDDEGVCQFYTLKEGRLDHDFASLNFLMLLGGENAEA